MHKLSLRPHPTPRLTRLREATSWRGAGGGRAGGLCGEGGIVRRGWQIPVGEATCSGSLCSLPVDEKHAVLCLSKNKYNTDAYFLHS